LAQAPVNLIQFGAIIAERAAKVKRPWTSDRRQGWHVADHFAIVLDIGYHLQHSAVSCTVLFVMEKDVRGTGRFNDGTNV
jgi:hypothetical protein